MSNQKFKFFTQTNILFFSIMYRVLIFSISKNNNFYFPHIKQSINPYTKMLDEKFLSFLSFEHTKPLAFFIKDYILFNINPSKLYFSNFILISVLNIFAVLIYYRIILKITAMPKLTFLLSSLLSISFVTWEYWRSSSHYDHLNIFIFAIFIHSSFSITQNKKLINRLYYFLSLIFILSFHSFGILYCLISIYFIYDFKIKRNFFVVGFISLIIYLILVSGNFLKYKLPLLSTVGGQNQLQFIWSNNNAEKKILELVNEKEIVPLWYNKCFSDAYNFKGRNGSIYGKCFPNPKDNPDSAKIYLRSILEKSQDPILQRYIKEDLKLIDKTHLFSGGVSESKLNFSVYYGKFSGKLARKVAFENPLITTYSISKSVYHGLLGSVFLTGLHYDPLNVRVPFWHKGFNYIISILFFLGFCFSFVYIFSIILKKSLRKKALLLNSENYLLNFSSLISLLNLAMYSLTTCCENSRMMVGILPYSFITMVYLFKIFRGNSFTFSSLKILNNLLPSK